VETSWRSKLSLEEADSARDVRLLCFGGTLLANARF
jgi:hypothetical protein